MKNRKSIRKRVIFSSIFLLFIAVLTLILRHKYQEASKNFISHTNKVLVAIKKEMNAAENDLNYLRKSAEFLDFLEQPRSVDRRDRLQKLFSSTIVRSPSYDQIRYIDETGFEQIRINSRGGKITVVPPNLHQQKNNRYYFTDTMKLKEGEVYLSPIDLNIENNQIEIPHVPTIRMSTPVFNKQGKLNGIIIINYRVEEILAELSAPKELLGYVDTYLVNSEDYWIKGPTPEAEWGFMFPDKQDEKIQKYFPLTHDSIDAKDDGSVINPEGVSFWVKFFPISDTLSNTSGTNPRLFYYSRYLATKDFHLTVVAHSSFTQMFKYFFSFH